MNLKRVSIFLLTFLLMPIIVYAQLAKDALMGLKKLEARVQAGISYREYGSAVGEAKFPVNLYLESPEAVSQPDLKTTIKKAMDHYDFAATCWNYKFLIWEHGVDKESEKEIIQKYPDADKEATSNGGARLSRNGEIHVDFLLPIIWAEASKELMTASSLLAKPTIKENAEIAKLKKENAKLKEEIAKLKQKSQKKK